MIKKIITLLMLFIAQTASAKYYAQGDIVGYAHGSIGKYFQAFIPASPRKLYGVKGADEKIHEIKKIYEDTAIEHVQGTRCFIYNKVPNESGNILINGIVAAVNSYTQTTFYGKKEDGSYEELDVQYISFECLKR